MTSRQARLSAASALAAAIVLATVAAFTASPVSAAASEDPALVHARAQLAWCQDLRQFDARTAADRTWADTCIRLAQREVDRLTPAQTTSAPVSTPPASPTAPPTTTLPPATTPPPVTSSPPAAGWPNASNTGTPAGWVPTSTRSTDLRVTTAGAVVQDVLLTNGADILVDAPGVTIRRVRLEGGRIDLSPGSACNRTRIEQVTIRRPAGTVTDSDQEGRITPGGWDVSRLHIDGAPEGLRAGGKAQCGANSISDSYIRIQAPDVCADWHGDGIQGYDGGPVSVTNVAIDFQERGGCGGTAPFFYPHSQGNTSATIDRLKVDGGGFSFRLGMPGTVRGLAIVDGSWGYGPIDVRCSAVTSWQASIVRADGTVVRAQPCNSNGGG